MPFTFTSNIKVAVYCTDGQLVFEFRRPENRDLNEYLAKQMDIKEKGADRMNRLDWLRQQLFDKYIASIYMERPDGTRDSVVNEAGEAMQPDNFPADVKAKAVISAFEMPQFSAKNF